MKTIIHYLKSESTWRGIIAVAGALGATLNPDQATAIIAAGMALVGLINVFKED